MKALLAVLSGLALSLGGSVAAEAPEKSDPSVPRGLEVRLVAKKTTYTNIQDPKKLPDDGKRLRQSDFPPAPDVDLALEIRNASERELHMKVGGRAQSLQLSLQGPGVFTPKNLSLLDTADVAPGRTIVVAPGKTYTIPIRRLCSGQRVTDAGYREFVPVYWTAPGDYTLSASFHTELGWRDEKEESIRLGPATLRAAPVRLTVKAAQK